MEAHDCNFRDDIGFITWDHPFVRSVIDLLADGEQGNASYGVWKDPAGEAMFLEIIAIVEPLAPAHLHVDRFLPPTPLRVAVDNKSNDLSDDPALAAAPLRDGDIGRIFDHDTIRKSILPARAPPPPGPKHSRAPETPCRRPCLCVAKPPPAPPPRPSPRARPWRWDFSGSRCS